MDLTFRIVRRLLRDDDVDFSRNRNFATYEDPRVQRAMRIFRHLRSLEMDLLSANRDTVRIVAVEREDGKVTVRISFDGRGRRTSYLSEREWQLLLESDKVLEILRETMDRLDASDMEQLPKPLNGDF